MIKSILIRESDQRQTLEQRGTFSDRENSTRRSRFSLFSTASDARPEPIILQFLTL